MSKFTTEDRIAHERENWKKHAAALARARERLKDEGINYPVWNKNISYNVFYTMIRDYSEKETKYMLEELRGQSKQTIAENPKEGWVPYKEQ